MQQLQQKGCGAPVTDLTEDLGGDVAKTVRPGPGVFDEWFDSDATQRYQTDTGVQAHASVGIGEHGDVGFGAFLATTCE